MEFERGKDPKEALNIGQRANALEIVGIAEIKTEIDSGPDRMVVTQYKSYERAGLSESHAIRILMGIEAMALNPEEYALVSWPNDDNPDHWTRVEKYTDMVDHLGKWVKFRDHLYRIPTYKEYEEFRESRSTPGNLKNWPPCIGH